MFPVILGAERYAVEQFCFRTGIYGFFIEMDNNRRGCFHAVRNAAPNFAYRNRNSIISIGYFKSCAGCGVVFGNIVFFHIILVFVAVSIEAVKPAHCRRPTLACCEGDCLREGSFGCRERGNDFIRFYPAVKRCRNAARTLVGFAFVFPCFGDGDVGGSVSIRDCSSVIFIEIGDLFFKQIRIFARNRFGHCVGDCLL